MNYKSMSDLWKYMERKETVTRTNHDHFYKFKRAKRKNIFIEMVRSFNKFKLI